MSSFHDNAKRQYQITMTLGKFRRIREVYPVDVFEHSCWQGITSSLTERLALTWYLVADQAESFGLDLDQWELALQGKGIANAVSEAFLDELENFYRNLDQAEMAKLTQVQRKTMAAGREAVNSPAFDPSMDKLIEATLGALDLPPGVPEPQPKPEQQTEAEPAAG